MTFFVVGLFCAVTKTNEYNQTFLHLLALPSCFFSEDACRPYGMSPADISSLQCSYVWKDDGHNDFALKLDSMTVEDVALLVHAQEIDINQRDSFGAAALHYAAMANPRMFNWLLINGASPYIVDNTGWNILHYAAANGHLDSTWDEGSLINTYVDLTQLINQQDENGSTPLHIAVCCGSGNYQKRLLIFNGLHISSVKWLLEHAADISISDNTGRTPLDYAKINNFGTIATLLEAKSSRAGD